MLLNTRLDCDLVAVESADELTLLVELTAPTPTTTATRQPATLQIVLDRSGSMSGDRLEGAKAALTALVDRLDPKDNLGIVAFDDQVRIVVPAGPLTDKAATKRSIADIHAGGSTDLSSGYLRGLQEARRVAGPTGATILLISDGHANAGVRDPETLGRVAKEGANNGITTSTVGFGLGYDETLLAALAQGGSGNELFAEEADTAMALIAGEVDGLLDQVSQAASLRVHWTSEVAGASIMNELPTTPLPDGFQVELGSFYAGEARRVLIKLHIPGIPALGLTEVASLELVHVSLPDLVQHSNTMPIYVNVVPGDQAAGRIRDPHVTSEALFQEAQKAKRESGRLLTQGDVRGANRLLRKTSAHLSTTAGALPEELRPELLNEARLMESLADEAEIDRSRAAKFTSSSATMGSNKRGRQNRGGTYLLRTLMSVGSTPLTLELEEWELRRLVREAPAAAQIRAALGAELPAEVAGEIAEELPASHPQGAFFLGAVSAGGFSVNRA